MFTLISRHSLLNLRQNFCPPPTSQSQVKHNLQWMADHRPSRSERDYYLQLKADRKNKRFISSAGVFLLFRWGLNSWQGPKEWPGHSIPGEGSYKSLVEDGWVITGLCAYMWKIIKTEHYMRFSLPYSVAQNQRLKIQCLTLLLLWSCSLGDNVFVLGSIMAAAAFSVVGAEHRIQMWV